MKFSKSGKWTANDTATASTYIQNVDLARISTKMILTPVTVQRKALDERFKGLRNRSLVLDACLAILDDLKAKGGTATGKTDKMSNAKALLTRAVKRSYPDYNDKITFSTANEKATFTITTIDRKAAFIAKGAKFIDAMGLDAADGKQVLAMVSKAWKEQERVEKLEAEQAKNAEANKAAQLAADQQTMVTVLQAMGTTEDKATPAQLAIASAACQTATPLQANA